MLKLSTIEKFSLNILKFSKIIFKLALYIIIVFIIGSYLFNFGIKLFLERAIDKNNTTKIEFIVNNNDTLDDVANNLYEKNLIDDKFVFKFRTKFYKININPGKYELNKDMTIKNILDIFDNNKNIVSETIYSEENENEFQLSPEIDE